MPGSEGQSHVMPAGHEASRTPVWTRDMDLDEARALWAPLRLERAEVGRPPGTCGLMMYGRRPAG
jgi:hypothetical protein